MESARPITLSMIYAGSIRVGQWWRYKNVVSPFYRLYYIESGTGAVWINGKKHCLTEGDLFLTPKFAVHSYECEHSMDVLYVCFFDDLIAGSGIPDPTALLLSLKASELDKTLFRRYIALNPGKSLKAYNPRHYNNREIYEKRPRGRATSHSAHIESNGILMQLFSRFITQQCFITHADTHIGNKYEWMVRHIINNIDKKLTVSELAAMTAQTPDNFTRRFREATGVTPSEYIQRKRIEHAQALLRSSDMPISMVGEAVGIYNPSQFSRLFTKIANCTPSEYRRDKTQTSPDA